MNIATVKNVKKDKKGNNTMNRTEFNKYITEQIAKLKEQISNLESQLEGQLVIQGGENTTYKPFPLKGDKYWSYDNMFEKVHSRTCVDDEGRLNAFKTHEEAQDAMELAWIEKRITDRITELNQGWTPNWEDEDDEKKYYFEYSEGCVFVNYSYSYKVHPNNWYMKNVEISRIILDEFKDNLIRWVKR